MPDADATPPDADADASREPEPRPRVETVGLVGLAATCLTLLVRDTAVTLAGVAAAPAGVAEEDAPLVRDPLATHPPAWVATRSVVVVGVAGLRWRVGVHRRAATAWAPWFVAVHGPLAPSGWLRFL